MNSFLWGIFYYVGLCLRGYATTLYYYKTFSPGNQILYFRNLYLGFYWLALKNGTLFRTFLLRTSQVLDTLMLTWHLVYKFTHFH